MDPAAVTEASPIVTALLTTAIKGFALSAPSSVRLGRNGAVGNRDFCVVDSSGRLVSITRSGAFAGWQVTADDAAGSLTLSSPEGRRLCEEVSAERAVVVDLWGRDCPGHIVGGPWSGWLSEIAGEQVELVRVDEPGSGYDEAPVTLLSAESVAALAEQGGVEAIDVRRFRMLVNIAGVAPYEEESWRGRRARLGSAVVEFQGPVPRCVATTRHPDTGRTDLRTLHFISQARGVQPHDLGQGLNLGVYGVVVEPGVVTVGDRVELDTVRA